MDLSISATLALAEGEAANRVRAADAVVIVAIAALLEERRSEDSLSELVMDFVAFGVGMSDEFSKESFPSGSVCLVALKTSNDFPNKKEGNLESRCIQSLEFCEREDGNIAFVLAVGIVRIRFLICDA